MLNQLVSTKDIVIEFANAVVRKDKELIEFLLSDTGTYQIQEKDLQTLHVGKEQFLSWFNQRLDTVPVTQVEYDICRFCLFGARVILFNNGTFPYTQKNSAECSEAGLALLVKENKIYDIAFCFWFLKHLNKPQNKYSSWLEEEIIEFELDNLSTFNSIDDTDYQPPQKPKNNHPEKPKSPESSDFYESDFEVPF
jgi:hypothetical protein